MDAPPDDLGVYIDVLLLDPRGYVPRLVLWDTNDLRVDRAQMYAAPAWRVTEDELGDGRVPEVEVWHLRSSTKRIVSASDAQRVLPQAAVVIHRLAGR
jgi:hypothetical protein